MRSPLLAALATGLLSATAAAAPQPIVAHAKVFTADAGFPLFPRSTVPLRLNGRAYESPEKVGGTRVAPPDLHVQASSSASTGRNFDDATMDHLHGLPATELKRDYLNCESDSDAGRLGISGIEACSMVYEELLQRVFGGDFDALLAWSRRQAADDAGHQLVTDPPGRNE